MNKKSETISSFIQKRKIMRKVGVICLSAFLTTSVFAQVTVNVKQQTIKQALRTIEKATDYRFFTVINFLIWIKQYPLKSIISR